MVAVEIGSNEIEGNKTVVRAECLRPNEIGAQYKSQTAAIFFYFVDVNRSKTNACRLFTQIITMFSAHS